LFFQNQITSGAFRGANQHPDSMPSVDDATTTVQAAPLADTDAITAWIERADREALQQVFARHAHAALRLARHRLGNHSDADDAVQHAFITVMRGARHFRPDRGTVRGYILAAVLNSCAMLCRSASRRRAREAETDADTLIGEVRDPELHDAMQTALAHLPEHQRAPVELRYLAGLDFPEIATALGRNERTVRGQVSRGLGSLRAICSRLGLAASAATLALGAAIVG
jgi:RNA polymerase sigma-70 factor (ECF subfamily)